MGSVNKVLYFGTKLRTITLSLLHLMHKRLARLVGDEIAEAAILLVVE